MLLQHDQPRPERRSSTDELTDDLRTTRSTQAVYYHHWSLAKATGSWQAAARGGSAVGRTALGGAFGGATGRAGAGLKGFAMRRSTRPGAARNGAGLHGSAARPGDAAGACETHGRLLRLIVAPSSQAPAAAAVGCATATEAALCAARGVDANCTGDGGWDGGWSIDRGGATSPGLQGRSDGAGLQGRPNGAGLKGFAMRRSTRPGAARNGAGLHGSVARPGDAAGACEMHGRLADLIVAPSSLAPAAAAIGCATAMNAALCAARGVSANCTGDGGWDGGRSDGDGSAGPGLQGRPNGAGLKGLAMRRSPRPSAQGTAGLHGSAARPGDAAGACETHGRLAARS